MSSDRAAYIAAVRASKDWKPNGEPDCSDCSSMSHCETHCKIEGTYPPEEEKADKPKPLLKLKRGRSYHTSALLRKMYR